MDIPAGIAAESALLRQNIALSVVKASADADQQIAKILEQSVRSAPLSSSRGTNFSSFA
jgi:hypothetical protein